MFPRVKKVNLGPDDIRGEIHGVTSTLHNMDPMFRVSGLGSRV